MIDLHTFYVFIFLGLINLIMGVVSILQEHHYIGTLMVGASIVLLFIGYQTAYGRMNNDKIPTK